MLGETNIGKYVNPLRDQTNKDSLINSLNKLEERKLESEKYFIKELKNKILPTEYPLIDISFLEKSSKLKINLKNKLNSNPITVPRFGVYQFYESNTFYIEFSRSNEGLDLLFDDEGLILEFSKMPETIYKHFLKLYENEEGFTYFARYFTVECEFKAKRKNTRDYLLKKELFLSRPSIKIERKFNGIMPQKTVEKVEKSLKYFEKSQISTITEIKPEQWNVSESEKDPLIIGIYDEKAYLIDHFDMINLEGLVKNIYRQDNLN